MRKIGLCLAIMIGASLVMPASADEPDLIELLKKVDETTKAVKVVSYEAKVWPQGSAQDGEPGIRGSLTAKELSGSNDPLARIDVTLTASGDDSKTKVQWVFDGERAILVEPGKKQYTIGGLREMQRSRREIMLPFFMREYLHATPFSDEINANERRYEGTKKIGDTECHVVYVVYSENNEARWYFGTEDFLPHRVDRILPRPSVQELTSINTKPKIDKNTFAIKKPEGYTKIVLNTQNPERESTLLAVGTLAPSWELKTPDDKSVKLSDLRGTVVVLDFWATWCGPCKAAMPGVQKLHEKFADKAVKVYAVNVWERKDAEPAKYMKDKEYTYGLLLEADDIAKAYKVNGIPTFYVIGKDGRIVLAAEGYEKDGIDQIASAISKALAATEKP